jgi:hypothetical protein
MEKKHEEKQKYELIMPTLLSCDVRRLRLPAQEAARRLLARPATLPRRGKSEEYFPQKHGGGVFHGTARRHLFAVKSTPLAARH